MTDVDKILVQCVDDIWHKYDKDGSGSLEKDEAKAFACKILGDGVNDYTDEEFEICFKEFD